MDKIEELRSNIDSIDHQIIDLLDQRIDEVKKIALIKKDNKNSILQLKRLDYILKDRLNYAKTTQVSSVLLTKMIQLFHQESLNIQSEVLKEL